MPLVRRAQFFATPNEPLVDRPTSGKRRVDRMSRDRRSDRSGADEPSSFASRFAAFGRGRRRILAGLDVLWLAACAAFVASDDFRFSAILVAFSPALSLGYATDALRHANVLALLEACLLLVASSAAVTGAVAIPGSAIVIAVRRLSAGRSRAAMRRLAAPILGVLILAPPPLDVGERAYAALRFAFARSTYDRATAAFVVRCATTARTGAGERVRTDEVSLAACRPITMVFEWGGWGATWDGVVYDESDEIARDVARRSRRWRDRPLGKLLDCSGAGFRLAPHYYRAGGNYDC